MQDITVHNCGKNCTLTPAFDPHIYSYYVLLPDNVQVAYFKTVPSEGVTMIIDDPTYTLTPEELLEKKVNQIVNYKVGEFENIQSMNKEEVETMLLSFYDETQIDNNTIKLYQNMPFYDWVSEFVEDDTNHYLIEKVYDSLADKIESGDNLFANDTSLENDGRETLDSDGLLSQPWTPVTVDIHYDLHHYRIFVIRKAGEFDLKQFQVAMELNKDAYLRERNCPDISLDAIIETDIPEWWDKARVWVVSFGVIIIMSLYIWYGRYSYNRLVERYRNSQEIETE